MPSYKTHSVHGEIIKPNIKNRIDINTEDLKTFCMGPDALTIPDYRLFEYQHANRVREYFTKMLKYIKRNKLQDNDKVMAFLYGQIDHLVLDATMHPLIYYMTEGIEKKTIFPPHGLVEIWIDDYVDSKYKKNQRIYYRTFHIGDKKLRGLIDKIYSEVFSSPNSTTKYNIGYLLMTLFDTLLRRNIFGIVKPIIRLYGIGDFTYSDDYKRVIPFLNKSKEKWFNPETREEYKSSFDELWDNSIELSLETINDVNNYLYRDAALNNRLILDDTSYNTGMPCNQGQKLKYIKKWRG